MFQLHCLISRLPLSPPSPAHCFLPGPGASPVAAAAPRTHHHQLRTVKPHHVLCLAQTGEPGAASEVGGEGAEQGPVLLPPPSSSSPSSIFATSDDPSPLQVSTSVLLTGAISVFLFRSLRRRGKRAKEMVGPVLSLSRSLRSLFLFWLTLAEAMKRAGFLLPVVAEGEIDGRDQGEGLERGGSGKLEGDGLGLD